jgi:hypothetical protein
MGGDFHALYNPNRKSLISAQIFLDCHDQVRGLFARACWFIATVICSEGEMHAHVGQIWRAPRRAKF